MIDPYEKLANGIILLAVSDYRQAMKRGHQEMQTSIERFFRSDWFGELTALNPARLIQRLQEEALS